MWVSLWIIGADLVLIVALAGLLLKRQVEVMALKWCYVALFERAERVIRPESRAVWEAVLEEHKEWMHEAGFRAPYSRPSNFKQ